MSEPVHPALEQLKSFVLGMLPQEQMRTLIMHLVDCKECRSRAETLDDSTDFFLSCLRGAGAETGKTSTNDPALGELLDLARRIPQTTLMISSSESPELVAGHELIRELARGGLGVVYLARHPLLNDVRAIKRPQTRDDLEREILLARFRREVRAVGSLRNDHIIRAHDAGVDAQGPYLVMEFVDGEPLSRLLTRHGRIAVSEACELARQTAVGLQAAHERGLVHRDIKPSNLMLARANAGARAVVIDWGLVKRNAEGGQGEPSTVDGLTRAGSTMGTYDYMAPEQATDAGDVDIRADIYSLGATLYCLLAGHPPFAGRSNREKLNAQLNEPFPPLGGLRSDIPKGLIKALGRMVEKDPARRYATPGVVVNELRPFCCSPDSPTLLDLLEPALAQEPPLSDWEQRFETKATPGGVPTSPGIATPPITTQPNSRTTRGTTGILLRVRAVRPVIMRHRFAVAALGAVGLLVLAAVLLTAVMALCARTGIDVAIVDSGKRAAEQPRDGIAKLVDEDFSKALAAGRAVPDGWTGNTLAVVSDREKRACLEVTKKEGECFVALPPLGLGDHFAIEGEYLVRGYPARESPYHVPANGQSLSIQLESSQGGAGVPIVIDYQGRVAIGKDQPRRAPGFTFPDMTKLEETKVSHFRLIRNGKALRVDLNGTAAAVSTIDGRAQYDTVRVGLTAGLVQCPPLYQRGQAHDAFAARLYALKIDTLPPSPATASSALPPRNPPDPTRLQVLVEEDFHKPLENYQVLPDGWTGDALVVVSDQEKRACLEATKKEGECFVALPLFALGDHFSIEGEYIVRGYPARQSPYNISEDGQSLSIQLESSRGGAGIPIIIDYQGGVTIGKDQPRRAPGFTFPDMTKLEETKVSRFRLTRNGKALRVDLNGAAAAVSTIDGRARYDTVRVGLTAGLVQCPPLYRSKNHDAFAARLYSLRIDALPR